MLKYVIGQMGKMGKSIYLGWAVLAALVLSPTISPAYAAPVEQIVNGDFETGTLTGWTLTAVGPGFWIVNDGTYLPEINNIFPGTLPPQPPISGNFDAVADQQAPSITLLGEPFTVPIGLTSATVSWQDRIFNHLAPFAVNQRASVEIRDGTGTLVLATIFTTNPGDPIIQPGPNNRVFDITTTLQPFQGQNVRICFVAEATNTIVNFYIDNVSLITDISAPIGGTLVPIDTTALLLASVQSISMWMIPVVAAGIVIGVFVIKRRK